MGRKRKYRRPSPPPSASSIRTHSFSIGQDVEILFVMTGCYYEATVISNVADGSYVVRYYTLFDDNGFLLRQTVSPIDLRPLPPPVDAPLDGFALDQTVDAYDGHRWLITTITARTDPEHYSVISDSSDFDMEFHYSELRIHQDWIRGLWQVLP